MGEEDSSSPKSLSELVYEMLDRALDYGITEEKFWDMTFAEIHRAVNSKRRMLKQEAQEKATYDYILAQLITKGVSKVLGDKSNYPSIEEAYPGIFDDVVAERKAKIEEQKMNLSALRFKQFANSYNNKFKNKEVANDK
jgi:hypothetical protein